MSPSHHKKKAYNISTLKNAAKAVVVEKFFAEDGLKFMMIAIMSKIWSSQNDAYS